MLKIYFGDMPQAIYNTAVYFDNSYLDSWITDPFSKRMIKDIDKATVLSPSAVESKALGVIPVKQLSGGVKTLILLQFEDDKIFNASTCGDNCARWILQIAKKKDLTINLRHLMDFGEKEFEIEILNSHQIVHNMAEYSMTAGLYL